VSERLPALLALPAPRAVVQLGACGRVGMRPLLDALVARGSLDRLVVVDVSVELARRSAHTALARHPALPTLAIAADPTMDLALPRDLAHPRLHTCLGNALGRWGTVGAVRVLRVVRATMGARDRLLLGLDLRRDRATLEDERFDDAGAIAACHLRVLESLNRELGTRFDPGDFEYRPAYDDDVRRVDTHLVAHRRVRVATARGEVIALRARESIRTSVDCKYERGRVEGMLRGVGLELAEWWTDPAERFAVAVAAPLA
jgi:L-histidine Nalpha-methyltransferase